ncbi:galactose-1-phosphate uridylyltransferase [Abditibacteriota bacterium]|nr:galactose-1-phosphate uridylyltransferase [Abditibacteriota bacterium]
MNPTPYKLQKTDVRMDDGRTLSYYDYAALEQTPPFLELHQGAAQTDPPTGQRVLEKASEMRWNPTRAEWTVYAAHRMNRVQLPSRDACPICPGVLELPLNYQIAIFENRSPSLSYVPGDVSIPDPREAFELTVPARGRADMVVYSQDHDGRFAWMALSDVYALVEAWRDRYSQHIALPEVEFVSIFENKGREAGMTLDHPHGQIYAFPFLPPYLEKQWGQTQLFGEKNGGLWNQVVEKELKDESRIIAQTDGFLAAMPFYARYPYEVHIWAKRDGVSSLLEMTPQERRELAGIMQNIAQRYENLWGKDAVYGFPTLMLMQQLSKQLGAERFRFHIEFYPLQRSPEKLKYRASIETGTGTFLNDALPENQAAELRAAAPHDVALPDVIFE